MRRWLRKLTRRSRLEREMREELAFHIEARAADLERSGLPAADAWRQARLEFGAIESFKEQLRDTRRFGLLEDAWHDLAYAWRNLRRSPIFTLSAAAAIALGIGLNTALFSIVYGLLFRPLPVRDPASVRNVYMSTRGKAGRSAFGSQYFVSFAEFQHMRSHTRSAELAAVSEAGASARFAPAGLHLQLASDNLLPMLGARPLLGRFFTTQDAPTPGIGAVAVLSYEAWQRYFNGANVVGQSIVLNRTSFTILGVADERSYGPLILRPDLWIPITMQAMTRAGEPLISNPNAGWLQVFARLKPGTTDASLRAELEVLGQQAVTSHTPGNIASVIVSPAAFLNYPDIMRGSLPVLAVLFLAVSLVLLVACANVANMLVARGFAREREIAIRLSIGAAKGRLVRQFLVEYTLLGVIGGAAALALAQIAARSILAILPTAGGVQLDFSADGPIAAWTLLIALIAAGCFGLPAALAALRGDLMPGLRGDGPVRGTAGRTRLQSALIATQVAVSAVLLINAGLLLRALTAAVHLDTGESLHNILIAHVNLRDLQYTPEQAGRYLDQFRDLAAGIRGVSSVALTGFEPLVASCGDQVRPIAADGKPAESVRVSCNEIDAGYLRVMHIALRQGRALQPQDSVASTKVALVDEGFTRRYFAGNALGKRFRSGIADDDCEIVGIVASTKPLNFLAGEYPQIYTPLKGIRHLEARLLVSYSGPSGPVAQALRNAGGQLDRDVTVNVRTIEENANNALALIRVAAAAVSALGALALLLACTGVYGVVAFAVARRRREIGVRMALGARPAAVARLLVRQSMRPVVTGLLLGSILAAACTQLIRTMLYGVSPLDPLGFAGALATLGIVAALAALLPARAALSVDPAATLRHE
jgi:putative ABC transport system permease protein